MKVAIVNTFDTKDIKNWSGIPFYLSLFLENIFGKSNVECISVPLKRDLFSYLKGFYYNRVKKQNYLSDFDGSVLKKNKKAFEKVRNNNYDLIITFQFFIIPNIKNKTSKIIFWSDATFQNLLDFYPYVSNLPPDAIYNIHAIQKEAFELSDAVILTSEWAISSARQFYHVAEKKLNLMAFSSNLSSVPNDLEVKEIIRNRSAYVLKLLFLGVDWDRKGGDNAVSVMDSLNSKGIKTVLYVAGIDVPQSCKGNENIISLGFINKSSAQGEQEIIKLLKECSILILPTKADCTPVAFTEANSYGLPVVTTNVGGITSVVFNNLNGFCIGQANFTEEATTAIENVWNSNEKYQKLCFDSYQYYHRELSEKSLEKKFMKIVTDQLSLNISLTQT